MNASSFLLPHHWQRVGAAGIAGFGLLLVAVFQFDFVFPFLRTQPMGSVVQDTNLTDELAMAGCIVSLLLAAFSRERSEDEYVQWHRLRALQAAVLVNYAVLLVGIVTVYGFGFLGVLFWNMFTTLALFILLFRIRLYRAGKALKKDLF